MFLDYVHPGHIEYVFKVSRDALYRHARALDLSSKRKKNTLRVLERIMEQVDVTSPTASAVVSAVLAHAKLSGWGQETETAQGVNPKAWLQRMSQAEREAFARDGSLPDWLSGAADATANDGQEGPKTGEVTESQRLQ
jgi:truncated hemoglobin YjbI